MGPVPCSGKPIDGSELVQEYEVNPPVLLVEKETGSVYPS